MSKIELEIITLSHSVTQSHSFAVILGEKHGNRRIPIVIGNAEAQAIAISLENIVPTRPLTHDLMRDMLFSFEINIEEIIIHNLVDGIFYSTIICKHNGETYEFDSRTSDAVALSTRFKCPIYTYESILEQAGVSIDASGDEMSEPATSTSVSRAKESDENDYTKYTIAELDKMLAKFIESEEYEKAAAIQKELDSRKSS
ncbi:MAG: bifunctional nuclease family protein [Bacteroidota bacterium]